MASFSLAAPAEIESGFSRGPPRHARKHSRQATGLTGADRPQLPAFSFSPGSQVGSDATTDNKENEEETQTEERRQSNQDEARQKPKQQLPAFTFNPGADIPVQRTPSPTHPILEEMALNTQRGGRSAPKAPLAHFVFPAGPAAGSTSPIKADFEESLKMPGHKRADSEFVGGKTDEPRQVMISPGKHEPKPSGPPVSASGYRSHTHRRSQAISMSDIDTSAIIKDHARSKANNPSNPSTPQDSTFSFPRPSPSHQYTPSSSRSPPASPRRPPSAGGQRRSVAFRDQDEIIPKPRPLSMISSGTETSDLTVRGHSVTNSINSIASSLPHATPVKDTSMSSPLLDPMAQRPNTADATLLLSSTSQPRHDTISALPKRPLSAAGTPTLSQNGSPPPRKKLLWRPYGKDLTPTPSPKTEASDPFEQSTISETKPESDKENQKTRTKYRRPSATKYHTWSFFKKDGKRKKKARRSPTPPLLTRRDSDQLRDIFDADNTVVLREDSPLGTRREPPLPQQPTFLPAPTPYSAEVTSPVLDLDAALDPFVEDRRFSEDQTRSTTARIAKLHSSSRGTVDAFGTVHRRTESAPALSPINRSALFGMRHQGSNASLSEDVFDEQEEDNFLAHQEEVKLHSAQHSSTAVNEQPSLHEGGLGLTNVSSHADPIVILDPEEAEDIRSSKSTIEAPMLDLDDLPKRPATSPMPLAYPSTQSQYASSTEGRTTSASLISSPDADHISFDTRPRRFEPNIDSLRPSTDDIPSLSDGSSSHAYPRVSTSGNVRPSLEQRSHSMFVPGTSHSNNLRESWKRSSLASLNRLIPGSSHGSKLKLEHIPGEEEDKSKKKTNRLSKLMKFWRSKEAEG